MKKMLFALLMIGSFEAMAQRTEIDSIKTGGFLGMGTAMDGEFYYASYWGGNTTTSGMSKYNLKLYNRELNEMATFATEVPEALKLAAQAFTGEFAVLLFEDAGQQTRTTLILNRQSEIVNKKVEENVSSAVFEGTGKSYIVAVSSREFVVVKPVQNGYELTRMDVDLNSMWSKVFKAENGTWEVNKVAFMGDLICLLREERKGENSVNYSYTVHGISANSGTESFIKNLNGVPGFLNISREMNVSVGGVTYKNEKQAKKADAVFFMILTANGAIKTENSTPLKLMEDIAPNSVTKALGNGDIYLQVDDLFVKNFDEEYILLGETYTVTEIAATTQENKKGKKNKTVTDPSLKTDIAVMDLVSLTFNKEGLFTGFNKIDRTLTHVTLKGEVATLPAPQMAGWLQRAGLLGYSGSVEMFNKQYIGFVDEKEGKRKLHFFEAGAMPASDAPGIHIDDDARAVKYEVDATANNVPSFGMSPGREGIMMLYRLNEPKLAIWRERVMTDMKQPQQPQPETTQQTPGK